ncbi:hypothetical protein LCGC14_1930890 [marine sediment metagenome]|uniref:Uncharacterized protein n=1 Tax=marine sediment metagenome TaxID=412755 RepID=A0A0F9I1X9_9ZZZZ
MKMLNKKRGIQLNEAFAAILAVVLVAVLVIVAIFLFEALGTSFTLGSADVVNESGHINFTGYIIDNINACNFQSFTVTSAINNTSGLNILVGNITTNTVTGNITNATALSYSDALISYTYTFGGESCDATDDMIAQFATYPALVGLVGTIVFLGLIIGILVVAFIFGGRRP